MEYFLDRLRLYRKLSLLHTVPDTLFNSPHGNLNALDRHRWRLRRLFSAGRSWHSRCATRSSKMSAILKTFIGRVATGPGFQASLRHNSKGVSHTTPHNQTFHLSRVSATQVCVSLDRLMISLLLTVSRALYPGTGLQALYLPEHPGRQPESRASTVSQEEQACDEMPVHRHLEQRYEPPPSQLSRGKQRKFKDLGRDLGQRFLRLVGIRKKSPPAKTAISFSSSRWRQLPSQSTARPGQSEGGSLMAQPPIRYTYDHDIDHAPCTLASRRITISF